MLWVSCCLIMQRSNLNFVYAAEIRERNLIQKYIELKAAGKLDSYIEKRQKKNASKDHRYIPYRRPGNDAQFFCSK
ncbi:hypothetical protein B296_00050282 [Ensete ventricosum]|uniref:rRNA biogenesis protein RRP36 n=1 Tax=Ensete ventricosum TaxID=4639 RepID=A0A426YBH0_ENSVE|nr:hypothetical protein B296_00050282 [Ensete ventricosum]